LAQIYKVLGNYEAYADIYRELLKMDPNNTDFYGELSSALLLLERYDDALTVFDQIERQIGVNEVLSIQKQQIYLLLGKNKKAIEEIEKLATAYPFEVRYQAMLAELYLKNKDRKNALVTYEKIKILDPDDPYVHVSLFEFYLEDKKYDQAFEELLLALGNPSLDIKTKMQIVPYWGRLDLPSETLLNQALQIGQTLVAAHPDQGYGYLLLAEVYQDKEDYQNAAENYRKSLAVDSGFYRPWEGLLFAQLNMKSFTQLIQTAERTLQSFPEQPLPYLFAAFGYFDQKEFEKARQLLETGRKLVFGNNALLAEFYNYLAEANHELEDHQQSYHYYDKTLEINPDNSVALNNYAYHLAVRGEQLDKALTMAAKAVNLAPENASNLDTYAWVFFKKGEYEDALYWIKKALKFDETPSGEVLEHYGDILFKLGETDKAVKQWHNAKEAGGASEQIELKIEKKQLYE
ncbi:MAG TPA: tetratricopeptide repeat protein, partial [Bacteroidales bacterium]|nr:tetratricopeptide repeat protein [Bacteroidales bacterium]